MKFYLNFLLIYINLELYIFLQDIEGNKFHTIAQMQIPNAEPRFFC
jgi:hypothetical protein